MRFCYIFGSIALGSCALVLRHIVRSMMRSKSLVVTWITASVLHPTPLCAPPVLVLRSPLVPLPLHQPGSANGHRLMVYRVFSYACFAFVIEYICFLAINRYPH